MGMFLERFIYVVCLKEGHARIYFGGEADIM